MLETMSNEKRKGFSTDYMHKSRHGYYRNARQKYTAEDIRYAKTMSNEKHKDFSTDYMHES